LWGSGSQHISSMRGGRKNVSVKSSDGPEEQLRKLQAEFSNYKDIADRRMDNFEVELDSVRRENQKSCFEAGWRSAREALAEASIKPNSDNVSCAKVSCALASHIGGSGECVAHSFQASTGDNSASQINTEEIDSHPTMRRRQERQEDRCCVEMELQKESCQQHYVVEEQPRAATLSGTGQHLVQTCGSECSSLCAAKMGADNASECAGAVTTELREETKNSQRILAEWSELLMARAGAMECQFEDGCQVPESVEISKVMVGLAAAADIRVSAFAHYFDRFASMVQNSNPTQELGRLLQEWQQEARALGGKHTILDLTESVIQLRGMIAEELEGKAASIACSGNMVAAAMQRASIHTPQVELIRETPSQHVGEVEQLWEASLVHAVEVKRLKCELEEELESLRAEVQQAKNGLLDRSWSFTACTHQLDILQDDATVCDSAASASEGRVSELISGVEDTASEGHSSRFISEVEVAVSEARASELINGVEDTASEGHVSEFISEVEDTASEGQASELINGVEDTASEAHTSGFISDVEHTASEGRVSDQISELEVISTLHADAKSCSRAAQEKELAHLLLICALVFLSMCAMVRFV